MSEHKRKMNKRSLENLQPFTENTARICGANGGKKKKENEPKRKALEQIKNEIIEKSFSLVYDLLQNGELLTSADLRDIFKTAVEMSGYKKQSQDINIETPNINIKGLNI
jgi:ribosomal protein L9